MGICCSRPKGTCPCQRGITDATLLIIAWVDIKFLCEYLGKYVYTQKQPAIEIAVVLHPLSRDGCKLAQVQLHVQYYYSQLLIYSQLLEKIARFLSYAHI